MKKLVLFFVLFIALNSFAAEIQQTNINVIVDSQGKTQIEETYFVSFSDQNEFDLFKQKIQQEISTEILKEFDLNISPKLEETKAVISFDEQAGNEKIKLNYFSDSLFSMKDKITSNEFTLREEKFSFLVSENKIVFPEKFSLRFVLPTEAEINEEIVPKTNVFSKTIQWNGPIIEDELMLSYSIEKTPEKITIKQTLIEIEVKENGFGNLSEKYFFQFKSQEELDYFVEVAKRNGTSLLSWSTFDDRIFPHIAEDDFDTKNASVEFVENGLEDSFLSIVYENESPVFIEKEERSGRFVEWVFNSKKLNQFNSGGLVIIPENTVLEITLPANSQIKENNLESNGGKIVWEGYKTTSKINLSYIVKENIAPTFNLSSIIQRMISNKETLAIILTAVFLISLITYFKRDLITEKIDDFVIKNTKIEHKEKIEIDIDD